MDHTENNQDTQEKETLTDNLDADTTALEKDSNSTAHHFDPIQTLEEQVEEMKNNWLRAAAENENIKKRAQREKDDAVKYGAVPFARDMVSVIDNLRRAVDACQSTDKTTLPENVQNLMTGMEMIVAEIDNIINRHHIKRLAPLHEAFNAHMHQAMFEMESEAAPGTITQVLQDGYILHDRLLRPAMVGVSKAKEQTASA